jgi:hypothetical protein
LQDLRPRNAAPDTPLRGGFCTLLCVLPHAKDCGEGTLQGEHDRVAGRHVMFLITKAQGVRPVCLQCHHAFRMTNARLCSLCETCIASQSAEQEDARRTYREALAALADAKTTSDNPDSLNRSHQPFRHAGANVAEPMPTKWREVSGGQAGFVSRSCFGSNSSITSSTIAYRGHGTTTLLRSSDGRDGSQQ